MGACLAFLLVLPLFAANGLGGGDAKLLISAGAFLGPMAFLQALLFTALAGAALSLFAVARSGVLLPALVTTADLMKYWLTFGRSGERRSLATQGATSVPYGVAIALGCTAALMTGGSL
jgi:prepilin peptidase CpaA